jgi:hypothetical protein
MTVHNGIENHKLITWSLIVRVYVRIKNPSFETSLLSEMQKKKNTRQKTRGLLVWDFELLGYIFWEYNGCVTAMLPLCDQCTLTRFDTVGSTVFTSLYWNTLNKQQII